MTTSPRCERFADAGRRRHLRVRESAGRAAASCSATSSGPASRSLAVAQDRADEKRFIESTGARVAPWRAVASLGDVAGGGRRARRRRSCSRPAATATTARARPGSAPPDDADGGLGRDRPASRRSPKPAIDFAAEFSVILARWADGAHAFWDSPAKRPSRRHPAHARPFPAAPPSPPRSRQRAPAALAIAEALGHVGVLTVEFFASRRRPGRQRDRAARAQQRPLDDRRRRHLAVRAAHPRDLRPAAGLDRLDRGVVRRWTI